MLWNMDSQHDSDLSVVDTLKMKMMRWISDSRKDYIKNEHICGTRSYVNLAKVEIPMYFVLSFKIILVEMKEREDMALDGID